MLDKKIFDYLGKIRQGHLTEDLSMCDEKSKQAFFDSLQNYPIEILLRQQAALLQGKAKKDLKPFDQFSMCGNKDDEELGWDLLSKGKVGTIVLAGGMATRLNTHLPKALVPVTPVKHKPLLQLVLEKTKAASEKAKADLQLAIMTSPLNREAIELFLHDHKRCGLKNDQLDLFDQSMLPLLDPAGSWVLEEPGKLALGPDGNGSVFLSFFDSGIKDKWKKKGIEIINIILIDNPLADPFDAEFLGFCYQRQLQVGIKTILRSSPDEKVGVLVKNYDHIEVAEYNEFPKELASESKDNGTLLFPLANLSLFCFSLPFLEMLDKKGDLYLPWHIAIKKAKIYEKGKKEEREIFKFETFLFDILPLAKHVDVLVYPREEVFSPLKNATGENSLETVQKALIEFDKKILEKVYGVKSQNKVLELDPCFYYPTAQLKQFFVHQKKPSENYISPD